MLSFQFQFHQQNIKKKEKKRLVVKEKKTNFTLTTEVFAENRTHTQGDKNP